MIEESLPEPIQTVLEEKVVGVEPPHGLDISIGATQAPDALVAARGLSTIRLAAPERQLRRARLDQIARAVGRAGIEHGPPHRDVGSTERIQRVAKKPLLVQARDRDRDA